MRAARTGAGTVSVSARIAGAAELAAPGEGAAPENGAAPTEGAAREGSAAPGEGAAPAPIRLFAEPPADALVDALAAALAGHDGPVLLLAPDVPRIDAALVGDALTDLREGCSVSISSDFGARACLLALARPDRRLLALVASGASRAAIVELVEAAAGAGGEVGFLRHERRLVGPPDARALAADPLADPALRALATPEPRTEARHPG